MGLYFEEFEIGKPLRTRGRTVGEADITAFAGLTGDWTPIHLDDNFARTTTFGKRIAHGPLTMSIAVGLMAQLNLFDGTVVGLVQLTWSFSKPVYIGDTLYAQITPLEKRLTSKPGRGVIKLELKVLNQADEAIARGVHDVMVLARPTE